MLKWGEKAARSFHVEEVKIFHSLGQACGLPYLRLEVYLIIFQEESCFGHSYYLEIQKQDEKTFSDGEKASFQPKMGWNGPLDHQRRGSEWFFTSEYWLVVFTNPLCTLLGSDVLRCGFETTSAQFSPIQGENFRLGNTEPSSEMYDM
ncbi:hypothetical protein O181_007254 [Austropuccinia psidii MF-1]|uniref:Uncharacterized protein n=1 Tax=Austropuccinia psidii MF-1 TaxID=1389203 RepID=A0A9Q3BLK8_9BASI|nr:hypothetical protein [Austropuccinia psidii MF-1]